ncbi:hypothetical protein GCM10010421_05970 [Streptomyces glaucus]|uniref:Uncharacterized protein n=1 Tax=Streptomyces glaucus TaxID=284029 RepID=A0ABP5W958_9ACTN
MVPAPGDADVPVRRFGAPERFLAHAERAEVLAGVGLTPVGIAGRIGASRAAGEQRPEGVRAVLPVQGET